MFFLLLLQQYSATLVQWQNKFEHFGGFEIDKVEKEIHRGKKLVAFQKNKHKQKILNKISAFNGIYTLKYISDKAGHA